MAYEIVTDLRHTYLLEDAVDINTWANLGPGGIRGIRRLLNLPLDSAALPRCWQDVMSYLLEECNIELHNKIGMPQFEMREVEHSLCEFDKYERARLKEGPLKRKYYAGGR